MSRTVFQIFETFQQARSQFAQSVAELAHRPQNIEALQNAGAMAQLRPLLLDTVPSIQQSAALALGRLANYSEALAEAVVQHEVLPQLVYSLSEKNRYYKKTAAFVLKSVAKHSPELAQSVVDANALEALVHCLSELDPSVREAAAWALGYIARHTPKLAQNVVEAGAVAQLVLCLNEPELSLKRIAVNTLSEISKHSQELAQVVVDAAAVNYLVPMIQHSDAKLKRHVCACLAHISKHTVDLAEVVIEAEIIPKIFGLLKDTDPIVKRNTATCLREIVKHTPELAQSVVNQGGHGALVEYCNGSKSAARLPAVMAIGYIAAFSEPLASAVINAQAVNALKDVLVNEKEEHIRAAAAWALQQLGRHTPDTSRAVAQAGIFPHLVAIYKNDRAGPDLKKKAATALKFIIQKCNHTPALEPLLHEATDKILRYVVFQFAKILPHNPAARKSFAVSKCLAKLQEIKLKDTTGKLAEYVQAINDCYPPDIVQYYNPQYPDALIKKLDVDGSGGGGGQPIQSSSFNGGSNKDDGLL